MKCKTQWQNCENLPSLLIQLRVEGKNAAASALHWHEHCCRESDLGSRSGTMDESEIVEHIVIGDEHLVKWMISGAFK